MLRMAKKSAQKPRDRGPSLVIWLSEGEKAVLEAAAKKAKVRYTASWARMHLLTQAEQLLGKSDYEQINGEGA